MLAQNFKSPADLALTDEEFRGLITTLGMMERGELTHVKAPQPIRSASHFTGHFNMDWWAHEADCGSVCCIGGTAELVGGFRFSRAARDRLGALFYPSRDRPSVTNYATITPTQAARALRSFLITGEPRWAEATGAQ